MKKITALLGSVIISIGTLRAQEKTVPDLSKLDPKKYNVCTITINSVEEKDVFKAKLPRDKFQFVELLDFGNELDPKESNGEAWLNKACESGVRCDMLVVSGHFGGTFFGSSGKTMSAATMERLSCSKTCGGIFNTPREAFLFGCNTLAGKEKDARTPEQYMQVLLQDQEYLNMPRATLESIVEARYGSFGSEFKDVMSRSFEGVPNIYGFHSVGPSGKNVKKYLEDYFAKTGNYGAYFARKFGAPSSGDPKTEAYYQKIAEQLKVLDKQNFYNPKIAESLKITNFAQCEGLMPSDPAYPVKEKVCKLYDPKLDKLQKMKLIAELMRDEKKLGFFPLIENVLQREYKLDELKKGDCEECKMFQALVNDQELRAELVTALKAVNVPSLKSDWLIFARKIGWLDEELFKNEGRKIVLQLIKEPITRENLDSLYDLPQDIIDTLRQSDVSATLVNTPLGIEVLDVLTSGHKLEDGDKVLATPYKDQITKQFFSFKGDTDSDYFSSLEWLMKDLGKIGALKGDQAFLNELMSRERSLLKDMETELNDEDKTEFNRVLFDVYAQALLNDPGKYQGKIDGLAKNPKIGLERISEFAVNSEGQAQVVAVKAILKSLDVSPPEVVKKSVNFITESLSTESQTAVIEKFMNEDSPFSESLALRVSYLTQSRYLNDEVRHRFFEVAKNILGQSENQDKEDLRSLSQQVFNYTYGYDKQKDLKVCSDLFVLIDYIGDPRIDRDREFLKCAETHPQFYSVFENNFDLLGKFKSFDGSGKIRDLVLSHPERSNEKIQEILVKDNDFDDVNVLRYFERVPDPSPKALDYYYLNYRYDSKNTVFIRSPGNIFSATILGVTNVKRIVQNIPYCYNWVKRDPLCSAESLKRLKEKFTSAPLINDAGKRETLTSAELESFDRAIEKVIEAEAIEDKK